MLIAGGVPTGCNVACLWFGLWDSTGAGLASVIPVAANTAPEAPSPRGAHSATLIGRNLWVFGGYGGSGYQRQEFNDLYSFDVDTMSWTKIEEPQGTPPARRSGHTTFGVRHQLLVYGGWNSGATFDDLFVYDTTKNAWNEVETGAYGVPRWNHTAVAIEAVPHWQVRWRVYCPCGIHLLLCFTRVGHVCCWFLVQVVVFGGSVSSEGRDGTGTVRSQGDYSNELLLLDTGRMRWSKLEGEGQAPRARADSCVVYDQEQKRLVFFGGFANRWFNDVNVMNVASVIGPPYAITGIEPNIGPVTGGTTLTITGLGFDEGSSATVRFTLGKKFVDATGTCTSPTTVSVVSPGFEHLGPGKVVVRVALRGHQPTITWEEFTFFDVTEPNNCLAFGPGVLNGCAPGVPVEFYIQSRDRNDQERSSGMDEWDINITPVIEDAGAAAGSVNATNPDTGSPQKQARPGTASKEGLPVSIVDLCNGKYHVTYTAPDAKTYAIEIVFKGTWGATAGPIRKSPIKVKFDAAANPANNKFNSPLVADWVREEIRALAAMTKKTYDGLTKEVPEDSLPMLLEVKSHLYHVAEKHGDVKLSKDMAASTLDFLKGLEGLPAKEYDKLVKQLSAGWGVWEDAQKQSTITKASIQPLVKIHGHSTKSEIQAYEDKVTAYAKSVDKLPIWQYQTGPKKAVDGIEEAVKRHREESRETDRMSHLAMMFEFPTYMDNSRAKMKQVKEELESLRILWTVIKEVQDTFAGFNKVSRERLVGKGPCVVAAVDVVVV